MVTINSPSYLTDEQLVGEVKRLAACERTTTADLVAHLAEMESRQLYLAAGFSSLFAYCGEVLLLPEDATCNRTTATRMVRAFPVILPMLSDGRLNLSTLRQLAPYLTIDNHADLLAQASRKSKREVDELIARWFPKPDVPTSIRKLPDRTVAATPPAISSARSEAAAEVGSPAVNAALPPSAVRAAKGVTPARRPAVEPLAEDRYLIKFTASAAMLAKLRQAENCCGTPSPAETRHRSSTAR